jgi:hypothetical protein
VNQRQLATLLVGNAEREPGNVEDDPHSNQMSVARGMPSLPEKPSSSIPTTKDVVSSARLADAVPNYPRQYRAAR